jgi:Cu/Ag efflux pump CusA
MTSTLLTLLVLPAAYAWFEEKRPEAEMGRMESTT